MTLTKLNPFLQLISSSYSVRALLTKTLWFFIAIVTAKHALLWTDCRYFLQSVAQMDENWTLMKDGQSDTINRGDWLAANLKSGKNTVKDL